MVVTWRRLARRSYLPQRGISDFSGDHIGGINAASRAVRDAYYAHATTALGFYAALPATRR